jgi:hypothetical protein
VRYVKTLVFRHGADGRWRLSGWTNFATFEKAVQDNIALRNGAKPEYRWGWWMGAPAWVTP